MTLMLGKEVPSLGNPEKLVRDKIPEIIKAEGRHFILKRVSGEKFFEYLLRKLAEEVDEFIKNPCMEEIADILEVLETISRVKNWSWSDILRVQEIKRRERGGFDKGYVIMIRERG